MELRTLQLEEFPAVFKRIKKDFAPGEYAPYFILRMQLKKGVQKGLLFLNSENPVAYAVCAESESCGYVLLSLFAIFEECRGYGYGSLALENMKNFYSGNKGMLVEVEKPEYAKTPKEKEIRQKRITFYEKAGFRLIPDIDYSIWDVPMHLMVFSESVLNSEIGDIIYSIYLKLMGKRFIHKMKFKVLK